MTATAMTDTQARRPVSGFAIATLLLSLTGLVVPAVVCGVVALGRIRCGTHRGVLPMVVGLAISTAWVVLSALFVIYALTDWR